MNRHLCSTLVALAGLLLLAGCVPGSGSITEGKSLATAQPPPERVTVPSPSPTSEPAAHPTATSAAPIPEQATATISVVVPLPTEPIPAATGSPAANADVVYVRAVQTSATEWIFHVTVAHPDVGWEDYADGWDVLLPDGTLLKPDPDTPFTRLLLHPHVDEQPFTRSQSGIAIPEDTPWVRVRAHDLVDGFGGREIEVDLAVASGEDFEMKRFP